MPDQTYQPYQPTSPGQQPVPGSMYPTPAPTPQPGSEGRDPAVDMIRQKIKALYQEEPDAQQEIIEATHHTHPGSKHQQFMAGLHASGRSMAEIQAAWHHYYVELPDNEKYEVWQEFYSSNGASQAAPVVNQTVETHTSLPTERQAHTAQAAHQRVTSRHRALKRHKHVKKATEKASVIKKRIVHTVKTAAADDGKKLTHKHHIQSAVFGLACGLVVVFIFLFSFFNEIIIAPLIQPSRQANDTPVIVDTASAVITGGTKIIIPKINLEIPVDYSQTTSDNKAIELALDNGVVHYPTTSKPGETGNAAFFGHSSNNIFNPGKYKFAFVLLHELTEGDIFYLNYGDKTYAYKVFSKNIVTPKQVEVLQPIPGKGATATLITCDPPGTSINRLVVVGEQISPDPNTNGPAPAQLATGSGTGTVAATDSNLPGNGPGLWSRIVNSIF